eukprot:36093-Eustigmatos_ZCMA.PRE.1
MASSNAFFASAHARSCHGATTQHNPFSHNTNSLKERCYAAVAKVGKGAPMATDWASVVLT